MEEAENKEQGGHDKQVDIVVIDKVGDNLNRYP